MGLLDAIMQSGEQFKRNARGLLSDPVGTTQRGLLNAAEELKAYRDLNHSYLTNAGLKTMQGQARPNPLTPAQEKQFYSQTMNIAGELKGLKSLGGMPMFGAPQKSILKFNSQLDDLQKFLDSKGLESRLSKSTRSGSKYLTIDSPDGGNFTIRFADHPQSGKAMSLHGPSDFNVGKFEYADSNSIDDAIAKAFNALGIK